VLSNVSSKVLSKIVNTSVKLMLKEKLVMNVKMVMV